MCSRTIHSNRTPKEFVQGRWTGARCRKHKGPWGGYEVVVDDAYKEDGDAIAWGVTPMAAWWEAANVR